MQQKERDTTSLHILERIFTIFQLPPPTHQKACLPIIILCLWVTSQVTYPVNTKHFVFCLSC